MTELTVDDARRAIVEAVGAIAPDVAPELDGLDRDIDLFEELQLDSMDHLNVMTALAERTGVEVPERDYPVLRSLDAMSSYLAQAAGRQP